MRSGLYLLALVAGASAGAAPLSFKNVNLTAPEGFLTGIDVSNYQGQIDWASVATTGISFAMCVAWAGGGGGGFCGFSQDSQTPPPPPRPAPLQPPPLFHLYMLTM